MSNAFKLMMGELAGLGAAFKKPSENWMPLKRSFKNPRVLSILGAASSRWRVVCERHILSNALSRMRSAGRLLMRMEMNTRARFYTKSEVTVGAGPRKIFTASDSRVIKRLAKFRIHTCGGRVRVVRSYSFTFRIASRSSFCSLD